MTEEQAREFKINLVKTGEVEEDVFTLSNEICADTECENFLSHDILESDMYRGMCSLECYAKEFAK